MRFVTVQQDEDLAALTKRIYASRSKKVQEEGQQALLRANPDLAAQGKLRPGTIVVVPAVEGTDADKLRATPANTIAGQLISAVAANLPALQDEVNAAVGRRETETKLTSELLRSPQLKAIAEKIPDVKERLPRLGELSKKDQEELRELRQITDRGFTELQSDVDELLKMLGVDKQRPR